MQNNPGAIRSLLLLTDNPITIPSSTKTGRCSFAIDSCLTMIIQPTCYKGPDKSILKTSTAYPSPYVDHQHYFSQQNPRFTAKENGNKSALVLNKHENLKKKGPDDYKKMK